MFTLIYNFSLLSFSIATIKTNALKGDLNTTRSQLISFDDAIKDSLTVLNTTTMQKVCTCKQNFFLTHPSLNSLVRSFVPVYSSVRQWSILPYTFFPLFSFSLFTWSFLGIRIQVFLYFFCTFVCFGVWVLSIVEGRMFGVMFLKCFRPFPLRKISRLSRINRNARMLDSGFPQHFLTSYFTRACSSGRFFRQRWKSF